MKKSTINFIINALMFLCMSGVVGIGLLIKYTLISGQERWNLYGKNSNFYLLGMDRHQWGTIHLIIGYILLGLLVLHIILHWNAIVCVHNRIFKNKPINKLMSTLFVAICALLIVVPFLISPDINEIEQGKGTHALINIRGNSRENITISQKDEFNNADSLKIKTHSNHSNHLIEVRGYMTLDEISIKYKIPTDFIKANLNIPKSVSDKQRLSWLRKKYNIEMSEVEEIIKKYQK